MFGPQDVTFLDPQSPLTPVNIVEHLEYLSHNNPDGYHNGHIDPSIAFNDHHCNYSYRDFLSSKPKKVNTEKYLGNRPLLYDDDLQAMNSHHNTHIQDYESRNDYHQMSLSKLDELSEPGLFPDTGYLYDNYDECDKDDLVTRSLSSLTMEIDMKRFYQSKSLSLNLKSSVTPPYTLHNHVQNNHSHHENSDNYHQPLIFDSPLNMPFCHDSINDSFGLDRISLSLPNSPQLSLNSGPELLNDDYIGIGIDIEDVDSIFNDTSLIYHNNEDNDKNSTESGYFLNQYHKQEYLNSNININNDISNEYIPESPSLSQELLINDNQSRDMSHFSTLCSCGVQVGNVFIRRNCFCAIKKMKNEHYPNLPINNEKIVNLMNDQGVPSRTGIPNEYNHLADHTSFNQSIYPSQNIISMETDGKNTSLFSEQDISLNRNKRKYDLIETSTINSTTILNQAQEIVDNKGLDSINHGECKNNDKLNNTIENNNIFNDITFDDKKTIEKYGLLSTNTPNINIQKSFQNVPTINSDNLIKNENNLKLNNNEKYHENNDNPEMDLKISSPSFLASPSPMLHSIPDNHSPSPYLTSSLPNMCDISTASDCVESNALSCVISVGSDESNTSPISHISPLPANPCNDNNVTTDIADIVVTNSQTAMLAYTSPLVKTMCDTNTNTNTNTLSPVLSCSLLLPLRSLSLTPTNTNTNTDSKDVFNEIHYDAVNPFNMSIENTNINTNTNTFSLHQGITQISHSPLITPLSHSLSHSFSHSLSPSLSHTLSLSTSTSMFTDSPFRTLYSNTNTNTISYINYREPDEFCNNNLYLHINNCNTPNIYNPNNNNCNTPNNPNTYNPNNTFIEHNTFNNDYNYNTPKYTNTNSMYGKNVDNIFNNNNYTNHYFNTNTNHLNMNTNDYFNVNTNINVNNYFNVNNNINDNHYFNVNNNTNVNDDHYFNVNNNVNVDQYFNTNINVNHFFNANTNDDQYDIHDSFKYYTNTNTNTIDIDTTIDTNITTIDDPELLCVPFLNIYHSNTNTNTNTNTNIVMGNDIINDIDKSLNTTNSHTDTNTNTNTDMNDETYDDIDEIYSDSDHLKDDLKMFENNHTNTNSNSNMSTPVYTPTLTSTPDVLSDDEDTNINKYDNNLDDTVHTIDSNTDEGILNDTLNDYTENNNNAIVQDVQESTQTYPSHSHSHSHAHTLSQYNYYLTAQSMQNLYNYEHQATNDNDDIYGNMITDISQSYIRQPSFIKKQQLYKEKMKQMKNELDLSYFAAPISSNEGYTSGYTTTDDTNTNTNTNSVYNTVSSVNGNGLPLVREYKSKRKQNQLKVKEDQVQNQNREISNFSQFSNLNGFSPYGSYNMATDNLQGYNHANLTSYDNGVGVGVGVGVGIESESSIIVDDNQDSITQDDITQDSNNPDQPSTRRRESARIANTNTNTNTNAYPYFPHANYFSFNSGTSSECVNCRRFGCGCTVPIKRRSKLPLDSVLGLRAWLKASLCNPYPTSQQKVHLAQSLNLSTAQVHNWLSNVRKRCLSPWLRSIGVLLVPFKPLNIHDATIVMEAAKNVPEDHYLGPL